MTNERIKKMNEKFVYMKRPTDCFKERTKTDEKETDITHTHTEYDIEKRKQK